MRKHTFIREKSYQRRNCKFKTVAWFEYSEEEQQAVRKSRRDKSRTTVPKAKQLNDDHSRQYFEWLLQNNFGKDDFHTTLTFAENLSKGEAKREFANYVRRLRRLYAKQGVPFDYIYVAEGKPDGDRDNPRLHFHIVHRGGVPRDEVEKLWTCGMANCDRLQPDQVEWLSALARYLMKSKASAEKHERVWNCSQGLKRPDEVTDYNAITRKRMRKLQDAARNDEVKIYLESIYPGWNVISAEIGTNPVTGRPFARTKMIRKIKAPPNSLTG